MTDTVVRDLLDDFESAAKIRKPFETVWEDIDSNLLPNIMRLADSSEPDKGARRDEKINDGGPRYALSTFQAGFMGRLMSAGYAWLSAQSPDEDMMDDRDTRMWLSKLNQIIFMFINRSKFYPQVYSLMGVAGGMGTGTIYRYYDAVQQRQIFSLRNPWEIYLLDDENGENDTTIRHTMLTYKNMVSAFGDDNLDDEVRRLANSASERNTETAVLHIVKPNSDYDPRKKDRTTKRYSSWYVDVERESIIRKGGYSVMPYSTWAIEKEVGEPYGRGPGWRALADIKALYAVVKANMSGAQYQGNPAADIPEERKGTEQLLPGGRNYYAETGREIKVIDRVIDLKAGLEREQHKQAIIERHFMVPFFTNVQRALTGDSKERTAYEVQQMEREAAILLGPYATGFQNGFMDKIVEGLIYDAIENKLVPDPPVQLMQNLNGRKLEVIYSGPLALAEKSFFNTEPFRRTLVDILQMMSIDPTGQSLPRQIMDIPDWDRFARELWQGNGLPEEAMFEVKKIMATRQARDREIKKQQQLAAMEQMGKAMPGLNQTVQPGSVADEMGKTPVAAGA